MPQIVKHTTLDAIKFLVRQSNRLVYGFKTCWWKVGDPVYETKPLHRGIRLPCGPRGEVLLETSDATGFIEAAEKNPTHYGEHGLEAFVAAYHGNLIAANGLPTSFETWDEYNDLINKGGKS